jgi:hypothetical protein
MRHFCWLGHLQRIIKHTVHERHYCGFRIELTLQKLQTLKETWRTAVVLNLTTILIFDEILAAATRRVAANHDSSS